MFYRGKAVAEMRRLFYDNFSKNRHNLFQVHFRKAAYSLAKEEAEALRGQNGGERKREMEEKGNYRHELKYEIGFTEYLTLRNRLNRFMPRDEHGDREGRYRIHSIYFDNYADKALREKRNGVPSREKFRIRYYNRDLSHITLEKKRKEKGLCLKYGAAVTEEECRLLLAGELSWMREHTAGLVRELYAKMRFQALRPKVLVSYEREAYVYGAGNVRVTFDSDLRTTLSPGDFLGSDRRGISAMDYPEGRILEIKYDAFLPETIRRIVQTGGIRQQAYSKYAACRRFDM